MIEYFLRSFWPDKRRQLGHVHALDIVGDDNFLWDTDYPHPDGTFPWGIDAVLKQAIPESSKRKILWDNPVRAFGLN